MGIFGGKKKLISALSLAFVFASVSGLLMWLMRLLPFETVRTALSDFGSLQGFCYCVAFGGFSAYYVTDNSKKTLAVVFALVLSSGVFCAFSGFSYSIIFAIALGIFLAWVICRSSTAYSVAGVVVIGVLVGLIFGVLCAPANDLLCSLCSFVKGRGALFGVINNVYSLFVSDTFSNLFYHSDYSSVQLISDNMVSGVVDIFSASSVAPAITSLYLSGKYFVNIFLSVGLCAALFSRVDDNARIALLFSVGIAVVTGDVRLISAFLVVYNPFVYLGYLGVILVSYFSAHFIDIRIGFVDSGSLVELFRYGSKWGYFLITGAVLSVLMYFVVRLVLARFDFGKVRMLPRDVRRIVSALGGEDNIRRIRNGKVYVVNPNLIDILRLDCDIHEDEITLLQNDLDLLQNYF